MKNIIIGQSGGPTAVINASLAGAIKTAKKRGKRIYGMLHGVEGLLKGNTIDLGKLTEDELSLLKTTPGAYLGSCRFKLPVDESSPIYDEIFKYLETEKIGYFLYIGGNDSMDTVSKLSKQAVFRGSDVVFLGVPKTVDNDLILTDHTPGFGSAAKYIATSVRNVVADTDAYDMKSVTIIEVMGRHAGWLVGSAALARRYHGDNPALLYFPEVEFNEDDFIKTVHQELKKRNSLVICVSEGVREKNGKFLCESDEKMQEDNFGHKLLSGSAAYLEKIVANKIGVKVRSFNLGLSQRCAGQSLSQTDVKEAFVAGEFALEKALAGETGKMVTFVREEEAGYKIKCGLADVDRICNRERTVPLSWLSENKTDVKEEFLEYVKPLVQGEIYPPSEDGIARFLFRQN